METGTHKIYIDGKWDIYDLHIFPYRYAQIYSFLYALSAAENPKSLFMQASQHYPWRGGYSTINYYFEIYGLIPEAERPQIKRLEYASPGFIELGAVVLLVTQIDRILTSAFSSWNKLDAIYDEIQKRNRKRRKEEIKLKELERKAKEEDAKFAIKKCKELAEVLGLENPERLNKLNADPVIRLKILLSFYRRLRRLLFFIEEHKVKLEGITDSQIEESKRDSRQLELGDE